jgi:DNA-binding NtrC family response regulator
MKARRPPGGTGGDEATVPVSRPAEPSDRRSLLVVARGMTAAYTLPQRGQVTLGRSLLCDIVLGDPSVSRQHAAISIGPPLRVHDLGSANGVFVRGRRLGRHEAVELGPGDVIELGAVTVVLQQGPPAAVAPAPPDGAEGAGRPGVIVEDPAMRRLHDFISRMGGSDINVLILGETGTGKEVIAEAIHGASKRARAPLVRLNCAALPEALLEAELFGHERGAFTGATQAKPGLLETADGGTVLLDEIGEVPLPLQAKMLRVLEERAVLRLGALAPRRIDVRFIAATNVDLKALVAQGRFRQDLYFRLNGVSLVVPPLRDRPAEIEALARLFAARGAGAAGRPRPALGDAALAALRRYPWPGNIRELRNAVERAVLLASTEDASAIEPAHLPPEIIAASPPAALATEGLRGELESYERQAIVDALARCGGNQTRAAELLRMPRRTLVAKLKAYAIPRGRA